ncbi:sigma-54 dependent transcriptional regulator [Ferrimonas marina]|uniref:Sigma-54 specific transcriptional regulator, flagellar regulatory protein A n=1 Tax=Ferrimonas marina TaxID=299255 RepID=A0A1M5YEQ3_9GAMM|nr:sigma-54 dependent transcriptional regulator [Ferrimonas marina]SHI10515.1 sigma-54 specific transcriptional regulator, flagellar regulatory protein A [Ferrimonas marina]
MQTDQRILLVDSDASRQEQLLFLLQFLGEEVEHTAVDALESSLAGQRYRAVLVAGDLLDGDLAPLLARFDRQPVLSIGETALERPNLVGRLEQPFAYGQVTELLHYCQVFQRVRHEVAPTSPNQTKLFRSLVGRSESVAHVRHLISQVAATDASVLVTGESGTGKEVVARNIHYLSAQRDGPFIPVNCGAIPPDLLESELFGHEKGAFTGAISTRKGRFELAEGGTLFLDEIGDMPAHMQVKILRVLQERSFERVGGSAPIKSNVRIVAATHRNLEQMIERGEFREDLFYRLNVFPIEMPALRERTEDIPLLLNELVSRIEGEGKGMVRFTRRAIDSLVEHPWSGNVRELSNLVERMVILCPGGMVDVNDLPMKYRHVEVPEFTVEYPEEDQERDMMAALFSGDEPVEIPEQRFSNELPEDGLNLKDMLAELEVDMIRQALDQGQNVVARAAELLGMRRTTLVEKMRKYGLSKEG